MAAKTRLSKRTPHDPDDAPALSRSWFEEADVAIGTKVVRRGRRTATVEKQVIRLGRRSIAGSKH
jgi:hypothetical protein